MINDPFAVIAPVTESASGWTVTRLVPNVDGILVGRNRKPRPFLSIRHAAKGCEDAFAIQAEFKAMGVGDGQCRVEHDGSGVAFGRDAEYAAVVAKSRAGLVMERAR